MRIGLSNISGKMGLALQDEIAKKDDFILQVGFSRKNINKDNVLITTETSQLFSSTDVIIDFSTPTFTEEIVNESRKHQVPLVIGTTGLNEKLESLIKETAKTLPILQDQNTSLGITIINAILPTLVSSLTEFDIDVYDKHHKYKVDAPSGTAKKLIKTILATDKNLKGEFYQAEEGPRPKNSLGVHVTRAGNIFGQHEISFTSESESIAISHTAFSRNLFASGALIAAKWLINQKPGLYSMRDVFGL